MFVDKKYFSFRMGRNYRGGRPLLYADYIYVKPDLSITWKDNYTVGLEVGTKNISINFSIHFGFVERERTEREARSYKKLRKYMDSRSDNE